MNEEQPSGAEAAEAPPSGPLSERLASKNWKWRVHAYEELQQVFTNSPATASEWADFAERVPAMLADKNAAAADKAVAVAHAVAEHASAAVLSACVAGMAKELVQSSLGGRPSARALAQSTLELLVEAEQVDVVVDAILAGCAHKTPKVRLPSIETLLALVKQFGAAPLPAKTLLKALPAFFNDSDAKFRALAVDLAVELHRFLGPVVASQLADLRPAQLADLQPKWAALPPPGTAAPTRFLRSHKVAAASTSAASSSSSSTGASSSSPARASPAAAAMTIDAYELATPVQMLSKMPKTFYTGVASAAWKERTAELDALLPLTDAVRLAPGDYGTLCLTLRKVIADDANAMCVQKAATVLAQLARGLRADFTAQARLSVPVLLNKFKEKKPFVVAALHAALDEIHPRLLQLGDLLEEIKVALRDKTPSTRAQTLLFVARALSLADKAHVRASLKPIAAALLNMLNDTLPEVRSAATQAVAALVTAAGESVAGQILASLDDMKRANIERAVADAAKKPAAAAVAAPAPVVAAPPARVPFAAAAAAAPKAAPAPAAAVAAKPAATSKPAAAAAVAAPAADVTPLQTSDQAADNAATLLPADVREPLASKVWKERLDAATKLAELCASGLDLSQPLAGDTVAQLLQATPGWKESNFQVVQAMFACFTALAQRDAAFSISTAVLALPLLVDKLGDVKLGAPAAAVLTAFAVALGPAAVFEQLQAPVNAHRNSKVKSGACQWLTESLHAFGALALPWAGLTAFAVQTLEDPRAKPDAVALLCAVRQHAGSDAAVFARTGDIKPALRTALEAEFAKAALVAVPQPTLVSQRAAAPAPRPARSTAAAASPTSAATSSSTTAAVAVRGDGERADISALLTPALMDQLGAAKWSDRDEAMSKLGAIISGDGGNRISANLKELPVALAARLTDSNKNLRVRACALVGQLGAALGAEGDSVAGHLLPPMLTLLGDNRMAMRDAVCGALDAWYDAVGLPTLAKFLAAPLAVDSSIVRRTLLAWLDQCTTRSPPPQCPALAQALPALLAAAEDRNADVRQLAWSALLTCVNCGVPFDAIVRVIDDLRPASVAALSPMLDAFASRAGVALPARRLAAPRTPARYSSPSSTSTPQRKSLSPSASTPAQRQPAAKPSAQRSQLRPAAVAATPQARHEHDDADHNDDEDEDDDDVVQVNMGARGVGTLSSAALVAAASKRANAFVIETSDGEQDDAADLLDDEPAADDSVDDAAVGGGEPAPTVIDEVVDAESEALSMQRQAQAWLDTVRGGEPSGVIETLKLWCGTMATEDAAVLLDSLDAMCAALAALLPVARNMLESDVASAAPPAVASGGAVSSAPGARFYKYLLNAIKTVFATRPQAQLVAAATLEATLRELLCGLVQPVLRAHADGEILMVAINQLVISVLEFADLSQALLALMRLLTVTSHSSAHPMRLSETIARALLKLAKAKLTSAEQAQALDVDKVMLELHRFLDRHPPHAWRADANFELRAVKTLLHTLVSVLGDGVREHLTLVPLDRAQPPVLVGYVHVMLSDRKRRQSDPREPDVVAAPPITADAKQTPTASTRENVAPNVSAEGDAAGNEAYLSRLRSLQQKYGLRNNAAAADAAAAVAAEPAPAADISAFETPTAAAASSSSIAELRARLARIKATSTNS